MNNSGPDLLKDASQYRFKIVEQALLFNEFEFPSSQVFETNQEMDKKVSSAAQQHLHQSTKGKITGGGTQ